MHCIRTRSLTAFLVLSTVAVAMAACDVEADRPRITAVTPVVVQQDKLLTISGEGFGEFVEGGSAVVISGVCAQVGGWSNDRIDIKVPTGVGVGARTLGVFTADGQTARTGIDISGRDLPAGARVPCAYASGPEPGPGVDASGPDADDLDATDGTDFPDFPPPDTTFPDFPPPDVPGPTCPIAVGPGACTDARDCEAIAFDDRFEAAFSECVLNCLGEGDQLTLCTADCVRTTAGIATQDCASCWGELGRCGVDQCLDVCLTAGPDSEPCRACQAERCDESFIECSGVLRPTGGPIPNPEYRWIQLLDLEGRITPPSGAEIDALVIERSDGEQSFARNVARFEPGEGADGSDPTLVLGPPDAFFDWPRLFECTSRGAVALGAGGRIVVELDESLTQSDLVQVLEIGGCDDNPPEIYELSAGPSPDGPWTPISVGEGPATFSVGFLP